MSLLQNPRKGIHFNNAAWQGNKEVAAPPLGVDRICFSNQWIASIVIKIDSLREKGIRT